jgi:predicted TIM-barrel fold metal-dependent hydrolase
LTDGADVGGYIGRMVEQKTVIARVFPRTNRHSMKSWVMGDIFRVLSERRIPLMIWHAETSWDTIDALCAEYPKLPVIVEGNDVKLLYHNRYYIPLFKKHQNLYLETHNVILHNEVDYFAKLDAKRLLFGSYHLYNTPDAAMSQIVMGDMSAESKQLIAHGNLERLISDIR